MAQRTRSKRATIPSSSQDSVEPSTKFDPLKPLDNKATVREIINSALAVRDDWTVLDISNVQDRPTRANTFNHPAQQELLQIWEDEGLGNFVEKFKQLETNYSPQVKRTRLHDEDWRPYAYQLCSGVEDARMRAMLANTYLFESVYECSWTPTHHQLCDTPEVELDDSEDEAEAAHQGKRAVRNFGLYKLQLAPRNCIPLTKAEFDLLIEAMIHALKLNDRNDRAAARLKFELHGLSLVQRIRMFWNVFFDQDALADDDKEYEFPGSDATKENLRKAGQSLIKVYTEFLKDLPDGVKYIPIPAEVGYSINMLRRMRAHRKLVPKTSPPLFQFMFSLLNVLFPEKQFKIFPQVVFRATTPQQVPTGESIASHLCASYEAYGGFNSTQAGLSVTSSERMSPAAQDNAAMYAISIGIVDLQVKAVAAEDKAKSARGKELEDILSGTGVETANKLVKQVEADVEVEEMVLTTTLVCAGVKCLVKDAVDELGLDLDV
ncbi:hypothetical protein LTR56_010126 [Elasticomyces elasticus]|nr:hypothetical protein LTR56_010126 [Elasticomyces elasticus]KAK3658882.1 hypothetical protein LTR22_008707 [Elasticomyces elasticus]KAK4923024.1 hypothetical protein LTR49_009686 [Elasticomyces elasticus]KAK5758081.1 hypothetical protein LTS12_011841 [Elasticomyces elasticus]